MTVSKFYDKLKTEPFENKKKNRQFKPIFDNDAEKVKQFVLYRGHLLGKVDEKATQLHAIASLKVLLDATKPQRGAATSTAASNVKMNFKETTLVADRPNGNVDTTLEMVSLTFFSTPRYIFGRDPHARMMVTPLNVCLILFPATNSKFHLQLWWLYVVDWIAEQRFRRGNSTSECFMAINRPKTIKLRYSCTNISTIVANASRYPNTARQKVLCVHIHRFDSMDSRIFISYGLVGECIWRNGQYSTGSESSFWFYIFWLTVWNEDINHLR